MAELKSSRLGKAAQEFNVGVPTIVEFLNKKGIKIDNNPNTKLTPEVYALLVKEYSTEKTVKETSKKIELEYTQHRTISIADKKHSLEDEDLDGQRDELFIRNMPIDNRIKPQAPREVTEVKKEVPVAEPVKEVKPVAEVETPVEKPVERPVEREEQPVAKKEEPVVQEQPVPQPVKEVKEVPEVEVVHKPEPQPEPQPQPEVKEEPAVSEELPEPAVEETKGIKVLGKIDLDSFKKPKKGKESREKEAKDAKDARDAKNAREAKEAKDAREGREAKEGRKKHTEHKEAAQPVAEEIPAEVQKPVQESPVAPAAEVKQPETPVAEPVEEVKAEPVVERESNFLKTEHRKLEGVTILGTMKLPEPRKVEPKKPVASSSDDSLKNKKKKRKRIKKADGTTEEVPDTAARTPRTGPAGAGQGQGQGQAGQGQGQGQRSHHPPRPGGGYQGQQGQGQRSGGNKDTRRGPVRRDVPKVELSPEDIQKQIKETLQRLSAGGKSKASKHRREKRSIASQHMAEEAAKRVEEMKTIMVAEFVTANELASLMDVPVNQIISTCLSLGLFVSINQRLDAETIVVVADEFGFTVKFVGVEETEGAETEPEVENEADLVPRAPIVTVMGHVDHGKTSLLDYIRHSNVIAGEAGGITQHIGAYEVHLENGKRITFLDTPGHEAFTAMRARGAKITDIVIIVIAADDTVMPQTVEAINHAQAAGVPIVFAINKIDKNNANPEKIREELSKRNILVEDWGGKYQSQEISAKKGVNVDLLLEKVLLEAEMLDLKANPDKLAQGTVLESSLDKGRGYVAKILVQTGTLNAGDLVLAGTTYGKVKAMYNERNVPIKEAGPSTPLLLLGLNGAPQAGDTFKVMKDERETKNIAAKRLQLQREQGIRTQKHITLDEIGRRIAIGDFKELNIIVKGDVDGSVEALADSLLKLSTPEVQVNIIHKSVGAVTESDVLLASASNAIIIGFQVRPSLSARKLAEQEQIDIRMYSIIYTAINEIKAAIEGMLSPEIEEKILCNLEVREVFKITKVGTVAGCMVLDGKIHRNTRVRIIRDGIVVYTGNLGSLKRFKDDVKEVSAGYECGLNIDNFNDLKVKDIIEGYEEVEIKRKL
ncbi:MAG TPA: translation initiation factor IF-2 [Lentimicrobium sp.]|nr:translation initiation factor IF-2 [Lentimicrobium sp.]